MTPTLVGPHLSIANTERTDNTLQHGADDKKYCNYSLQTICKLRLTITSFQPQPNDRM